MSNTRSNTRSNEQLRSLCASVEPGARWETMPGGASLRRFYRVRFPSGLIAIAMFFPDAQTTGAARLPAPPSEWPFLTIHQLLSSAGLRVPQLLAQDLESGWLLVEDLGQTVDDVLTRSQGEAEVEVSRSIYVGAVAELARAQSAFAGLPASCVVAQRTLDAAFLLSELEHFYEYGLEARGLSQSSQWVSEFMALGREVTTRIASQPIVFCHRDYQSRNLMVVDIDSPGDAPRGGGLPDLGCTFNLPGADRNFTLGWIDFQDATLGPHTYDLVALLRDSYRSFDEAFVVQRLNEFVSLRSEGRRRSSGALAPGGQTFGIQASGTSSDARRQPTPAAQEWDNAPDDERAIAEFYADFDWMTIQRKLKDAGRFVFIEKNKGDPSYLRFVEPSLSAVGHALHRRHPDPMATGLWELLRPFLSADER